MTCYVILSNQQRHQKLYEKLKDSSAAQWVLINDEQLFNYSSLINLSPKYIFVPHWSKKIPKEIYSHFICVMFHMTDLPYGRGGSPLQNLIARGKRNTMLSAFKCVEALDAGPIYAKKSLSLHGTAQEIFTRADMIVERLIDDIITTEPSPTEQTGEVTHFTRRTPVDSDLVPMLMNNFVNPLDGVNQIYDHIRMLDADGYPKAFIAGKSISLEFTEASVEDGKLTAKVVIQEKNK